MCFAFLTYVRFSDKSNENSRQYRRGKTENCGTYGRAARAIYCALLVVVVVVGGGGIVLDFRD